MDNGNDFEADLPLAGLRVIDLADGNGELCGRLLADFGADVIRVEPPQGAGSRTLHPFAPDGETSLYFAYRNFNKRGIVLDLEKSADVTELERLLASADVLIESGKPGELASLGLDPQTLPSRFPHLVVCSITAFGQDGPYADFEATADTLFALSGWLTGSGIPEKPPLLIPGALAYDAASIVGCFAVLCGLVKRKRTGLGQHLDVSALEALAQCNTWQLPNATATLASGGEPNMLRSGSGVMYPSFPTKDGHVRLVVLAPRQWKAIFEWMGSPEEFADPMWADTFTRIMNADVINPYYERFFAQFDMVPLGAEAQSRGVVATPMLKPSDVLDNEHYLARETFTEVEVAAGVTGRVVDGPVEADGSRLGFRFRSPKLGEHTAAVLAEQLEPIELDGVPDDAQPLAGLRVADFGHGGVGVEGGRMLAEYGADVVKIESSTYPDFMRIVLGGTMTPSFASSSRSKRSFGVNAKEDEGRELLYEFLRTADIAIENNSTGTMEKLGTDWDTIHALNPNLTMASSQMMGAHGPYGGWIGYGPTIQPMSGLTWLWSFGDGDPPPGSTHIHPDHMAGRLCAIVGLLGVLSRDRRGQGFHGQMAQVEKLMLTIGDLLLAESLEAGAAQPRGNSSPDGAPWGVYPCEGDDAWCTICVRNDHDWLGLVAAMDTPEWATAADLVTVAGRRERRAEIDDAIAAWTATLTSNEVMLRCQKNGVAAAAMLTAVSQLDDPHLQARGFLVEVDQTDSGPLTFEGPAFYGSDMPKPHISRAPGMGEHSQEIARELGRSEDEIAALVAKGVLETP